MAAKQLTDAIKADLEAKWASCEIDHNLSAVKLAARRVFAVKTVCEGFGDVPYFFVALCWLRECNLNPKGVLHNGELIVGTNKKTKLVPAGRGPFATWREAAEDAVRLKGWLKVTDWSVGATLFRLEGFNGYGYRNKGVPSPYLWSHTNHYADGSWDDDPRGGKYVADHVWKGDVFDKQVGVAAVLKELMVLDPSINFGPRHSDAKSKTIATARGTGMATAATGVAIGLGKEVIGSAGETVETVRAVTDQAGQVVGSVKEVVEYVPDGWLPWAWNFVQRPGFLAAMLAVVLIAWGVSYVLRRKELRFE